MDLNFIITDLTTQLDDEDGFPIVHFFWNNSRTSKLFWNYTIDEAIEIFKEYASEYDGHIDQDVHVMYLTGNCEYRIKTPTHPDGDPTVRSMISETQTRPES
ncbi:TPA: hypothetical protein ACPVYK_001101 [Vibrio parahaemolyticus]